MATPLLLFFFFPEEKEALQPGRMVDGKPPLASRPVSSLTEPRRKKGAVRYARGYLSLRHENYRSLLRDSDTTAISCLESTTLKLFSLTARTSGHSKYYKSSSLSIPPCGSVVDSETLAPETRVRISAALNLFTKVNELTPAPPPRDSPSLATSEKGVGRAQRLTAPPI
ncbi:hypothetical protein PO909_032436 [Leuciscus waleckii]